MSENINSILKIVLSIIALIGISIGVFKAYDEILRIVNSVQNTVDSINLDVEKIKKDVADINVSLKGMEEQYFSLKLKNISKQAEKILNDPDDVKVIDIIEAQNDCLKSLQLFPQHMLESFGTRKACDIVLNFETKRSMR